MKNLCLLTLFVGVAAAIPSSSTANQTDSVYMANGVKIGEVTSNSAIVWTRLTRHPERNIDGKPFPKNDSKTRRSLKFDDLDVMEGSVPGAGGQVRLSYWPKEFTDKKISTPWQAVDAQNNFVHQFSISGLSAGTKYELVMEGRALGTDEVGSKTVGSFNTAHAKESTASTTFAVITGQDYPRRDDKMNGHQVYPAMQKLGLNFFVHTGDIEYYDKPQPFADNVELARFKWNRIYSMPFQRNFHNHTSSYFIKDDHDTLKNDSWPGQTYGDLTWEQGLNLYREQIPIGEKTYRTVRWGKDLQIWMVEGRDFRSPNNMPDGPKKTIWGKEQKKWLFDSIEKSDATFRVLISPTPIVGPDRGKKNDNHANTGFTHEGNEVRSFLGQQKNLFVVCGDRHWQYVSVDPKTGVKEYSTGPTTNVHAGGFSESNRSDMHKYLKIKGGFLSATVSRESGKPTLTFRHHSVTGAVYNEVIETEQ